MDAEAFPEHKSARGENVSDLRGLAGKFFIGDMSPLDTPPVGDGPFGVPLVDLSPDAAELARSMSEQDLRKFVRAEVRKALDELAAEVATNKALQPTKQAGTCCACLGSGDDMVWVGNRLAHKDEECRRKAASLSPVREHRG